MLVIVVVNELILISENSYKRNRLTNERVQRLLSVEYNLKFLDDTLSINEYEFNYENSVLDLGEPNAFDQD